MYPFYLGIDLRLKRSYLVLMNAEREIVDKQRLKNTEIKNYIERMDVVFPQIENGHTHPG